MSEDQWNHIGCIGLVSNLALSIYSCLLMQEVWNGVGSDYNDKSHPHPPPALWYSCEMGCRFTTACKQSFKYMQN